MSTVSGVRITTLPLRTCNLTTITCDSWGLVTNQGEEARHISWAFKLLALCLNNTNNRSERESTTNVYVDTQQFLTNKILTKSTTLHQCILWTMVTTADLRIQSLEAIKNDACLRSCMYVLFNQMISILFCL